MNTIVTSRKEIIDASKILAAQLGPGAVNVRKVAEACGVSVGSIYNYFTCKADLVTAVIESVWKDTFHMSGDFGAFEDFISCVNWFYECVQRGTKEYPSFFTSHAIGLDLDEKVEGRQVMSQYFAHMKQGLLTVLRKDEKVCHHVFDEIFTEEAFIDYVFSNILMILIKKDSSITVFIQVLKRVLYNVY